MHKLEILPPMLDVERAVRERYEAAARERQPALCCAVDFDPRHLANIPPEIIERDYGCGDPSRHLREGEVVLDLGSGTGKVCYIAAQIVGPRGKVIGVDRNDEMLALARRHQQAVAERIGWHNTAFHKGSIQDLALDLEAFEAYLAKHKIQSANDWLRAEAHAAELRAARPLIADESIDVVVSNCVLNLVREQDRRQLFDEILRVVRPGGRVVISDITSDEPVPDELKNDPQLWSGCVSGAFVEQELLGAFEQAGFVALRVLSRQEEPWTVVEDIEFRSVTIEAHKPLEGPHLDGHHAAIYLGPWKAVLDDEGQTLHRGERMAVSSKTFEMLSLSAYADHVVLLPPSNELDMDELEPFDIRGEATRDPRLTKGQTGPRTAPAYPPSCRPGDGCCS